MVTLLLFIIVVLVFIYVYFNVIQIPDNFPPGPIQFPIWGGYYQILFENFRLPYKTIHNMAKRYKTNVIGTFLGPFPTVIACDTETVRDVLLKPEFQGRVDAFVPRYRADGERLGIIFSEGDLWQEQRRFMLRNMRDFGFGKRSDGLEQTLHEEVNDLIELLKNGNQKFCKNGFALLPDALYGINANMAFEIYSGDRKPFKEAWDFGDMMALQARVIETTTGALNMTPWMRFLAPGPIGYSVTKRATKYAKDFIRKMITDHSEKLTDETSNDFIDRYIHEMRNQMAANMYSTFSEKQLEVIGMDMLFAASTTIPFMSGFILLLLTKYKDVQKKCQEEIDDVVGRNRLPGLSDRVNMPYNEAMIREAMRYQTLVPLGVPHKAIEDTTLGGYFVPKDTMVLTSLYSAHMDEKVWDDPETFSPERFIDSDGKLLKKDLSVPFGLGKRVCAGETFARQNIFVTMTGLLQNFNLIEMANNPLPDLSENITGISESPKPFWIKFAQRV